MASIDALKQENEALRNRISKLSAASLRISASLDLDTILSEVVESARALTEARYGLITTIGDSGPFEDFVTSGFTPDEHRLLLDSAAGPQLCERVRDSQGALKLPDLHDDLRSRGYSPHPRLPKTVQGTAMRHRGVHFGNFFLADKAGHQQFTSQDEEVLVLLASQAAAAIANARAYRDEHRARTDLQTLIETSPVGVVVFDAGTRHPVSFNREADRILSRIRIPGHPPEHLLNVATCRFLDGREIALAELPIARVLSGAETVRAEQIELSAPDGRRITVLVNATPIQSAGDEVESVIVTMQDLAPLEELERSRAEFLSMVTHELRAPLTSIKGSTATVLRTSRVLDPAEVRQFFRIIDQQANRMDGLISDLLDAGRIKTGTLSVAPEPAAVAALVDEARNTFLSGGGRHSLRIDLPTDLPPVMADERRIVQVLNNLVSNAARHSPETSVIRIDAVRDGGHVALSVSDEGSGLPPNLLLHLFRKYGGGRGGYGLGLAICKGLVEAHGGRIRASSGRTGQGTRFTFTLPVASLAGEDPTSNSLHQAPARYRSDPTRILVLDDDPETLRQVHSALAPAGYTPLITGDPGELPHLLRTKRPHLVLLDLMLPGADGIELMESVPGLADLPVIFLSGYDRDETIARALRAGAADYIVKPFSPTELTARVQAALRLRTRPAAFRLADLAIDYDRRRVTLAGRLLNLTATEFELLRLLSRNAGRVVAYDVFLRDVWNDSDTAGPNAVRSSMKKLRRKLGDDAVRPTYIFNEFGVGYRMPDPSEASRP